MSDVNNNEATSDAELDRIIAQYLAQVDSGELVDQESFIAEHPNYATALGEYFRDVAVVEQLANPDQGWGTNTIVDNSRTSLPENSQPDSQTIMRGAADSQTSIRPDGAQQQSASTIEGEFGRYRILKTLGQGGMGAVYLAHDSQLDRRVALKIPKFEDDLAGEMLERFYREARAAAMLRSPNICPVYDVGEIDGQHYITMAYIEGRPLKDFAKSTKRHSAKQIAVTIRKLATGLSEAHAAGVIHRDLKPANIMIDQKNEPVVMDFGLARRNAAAEVEVTRSGAILGTPAYMSPEQVEGDPADIGPQADVYGLGVIMYQLLTGTLPFQGTLMGILRQIALDEPKPPSELRKGLDSTIEGICLKMMAKDRAERYQSMDDVARDLSKYLKNPPKSKTTSSETETTDDSSRIGEESNPVLRTVPPQVKAVTDFPQIKPIPKQSTSEKNPKRLAGEQRSALNRKIVIAVAAIAVLGLLYGAITLFLRVGEVDVKVVIDDPSISVHFEEGGVVKFEGSGKPIRLSPGKQKFVIERDGFKAETDEFQVKKDGKNILHVSLVNGKVAVLRNGERPAAIARGDTRATGTSKSSPSASTGRFGLDFDGCVDKWGVTAELNVTADVSTIEAWITPTRSSTAAELPPTIRMAALFDRIEALADYRNSKQRLNLGITPRDSNNTSSGTFWDLYRTHKNITAPLNMGERVHVAGVVTQSSQNLYVNGRKVASELYTSEPHTYKALGLGTLLIRQWGYSGTMDEFRFSKGARYTGDFQPPQRFEADKQTVVLYHFDEGQGKVLKDSSGNGYHGTIKAAKWVRIPDRERKAAEWIFSLDNPRTAREVRTNLGRFTSLEQLPKEEFFITKIYLGNHGPRISDEEFSQLNGLSRIEGLILSRTFVGDEACRQFAKLTSLKLLRLDGKNISDEGIAHLKRLPHLKDLKIPVTDEGLRHLAGMTDLEALVLTGREFSDKGLSHVVGLQNVKLLGLDETRVSDDGLSHVGKLVRLEYLRLRQTRVTDKGLAHLKGLEKLRQVYLQDTQVTAAGVADLRKALPNCNILYGPTTSAPLPSKAPFNEAQAKAHQKAWADYLGLPVEKEVALPGGAKMQFMLIPPGEFMMGSSDEDIKRWQAQEDPNSAFWQGHLKAEGPQHRVRITQPFYLGKYEVTRAQWDSVSSGQPSKSTDQTCGASWDDTQPFLQKLNEGVGTPETRFALPTEAQWEFACRAGTTTAWYSGDDEEELQRYAWISANAGRGSKPIGQRLPNAFGLYDMHGNVPEWCADWYSPDYYAESPTEDPTGPSSGTKRVTRGGGSISAATRTRSARRHPIEPSRQNNHPGFRVAISIDTAKLEAMPLPSADPAQERKAAEWVLSLDERRGSRRVSTNLGEFTALEQLPKEDFVITQIDLRNQPHHISDEGFAQLNGLSHIERLHIHATNVGDVACQHIAKLTTLNYLAFVQTNVSDEGLVHLKRMPHLENLSLSYGNKKITNAGLQHLAGMTNLQALDVSGTNANDAGLVHFVGLKNLERLGLNKTRVSDVGLLQFEKLVRLDSLELRETRVTDGGLAHLKGLKTLTYIDLRDTQVTAAGVADLQKALPNCRILHGPIASAPPPSPFDHLTRQDAPPTDPPLGDDIPLVAVLAGDDLRLKHWNMITQIAISADGKHLVTASADQTIKVWDAETGKLKRTLSSREHAPGRIAISPDGKTLASVGQGDDRLWLWDIESGELRRSKAIVQNINLGRSWMPDGRQIVMIGDPVQGKELVFVNTETLEVVARLKYQAKKAWMPVVSPDGNWLALASQIGEGANRKTVAQLWNLSMKEFVGTVPLNGALGFTKDSRQVFAGTKAFDVNTRAEVLDFSTDPRTRPLGFSPDLKLYLQRRGSGFTISGVDKSRALVQLGVPSDPYRNHAAFFPDGKRVVTASQGLFGGNSVRIWSTDTGQELMTERGDVLSHLYGGLVFSSDGQTLFRTENSRVIKRDLNTGRDDGSFDPKDSFNAMRSVDVTEDGNYLAVYANYGKVWLWNLSNGSETRVSHSAGNHIGVARLAFNRAGSLLAIPGDSGASLCDLPSGEEIQTFVMPEDVPKKDVTSVAFSPDGKRLAMGGVNNVIFRDIDKSSETSRLQMEWKNPQHVLGMSFSPDGALIAIGSREFVEIWDVKQRHRVAELPSEANCRSVSFSPDGSMVAWGCDDGMVRLWDVAAGKLLAEYQIGPPRGIIRQVAFTPDSRYLATANGNGSVYVLRLPATKGNEVKVPPATVAPFDEGQAKKHQHDRAARPALPPGRWTTLLADEKEFAKWDVKRGDEKSVTFANGELTMRAVGEFVKGLTLIRDLFADRFIIHAEHNKQGFHTGLRLDFGSIWYSPIHFHHHSHELWKGHTERTETEKLARASLENDAGYEKWGRFDYVVLDGKITAYANGKKLYSAPIENNPLTMLRIVGSNSTTRWRNLGIMQLTEKQAADIRAGKLPQFPAEVPKKP